MIDLIKRKNGHLWFKDKTYTYKISEQELKNLLMDFAIIEDRSDN